MRGGTLRLTLVWILLIVPAIASAATVTWDGGGANTSWSTAGNWSGDTAPTSSGTYGSTPSTGGGRRSVPATTAVTPPVTPPVAKPPAVAPAQKKKTAKELREERTKKRFERIQKQKRKGSERA